MARFFIPIPEELFRKKPRFITSETRFFLINEPNVDHPNSGSYTSIFVFFTS